MCFGDEEAACFGEGEADCLGEEAVCLAGVDPFLTAEDVFCGFSAEEAAGSEFAREKERSSVRNAERTVDSPVDCRGLARTRGLTAFLCCESIART
jgi:hypothetical protein